MGPFLTQYSLRMHGRMIAANSSLPVLIPFERSWLLPAGLFKIDKRIVAILDERSHCESSVLIVASSGAKSIALPLSPTATRLGKLPLSLHVLPPFHVFLVG